MKLKHDSKDLTMHCFGSISNLLLFIWWVVLMVFVARHNDVQSRKWPPGAMVSWRFFLFDSLSYLNYLKPLCLFSRSESQPLHNLQIKRSTLYLAETCWTARWSNRWDVTQSQMADKFVQSLWIPLLHRCSILLPLSNWSEVKWRHPFA